MAEQRRINVDGNDVKDVAKTQKRIIDFVFNPKSYIRLILQAYKLTEGKVI